MVYRPIPHKKLYTDIFQQLQELFETGALKPGERLPSERDLADTLQVSRNSLREAFKVLEMLGLISIIPGSGTYVRESKDNIILPLALSLSVEQNSMLEILEVRQLIETHCARLAASRGNDYDIKEIEKALLDLKNAVHEPSTWIHADLRFHYQVAKAAKNLLLLRLLLTFTEHMSQTIALILNRRFTSEEGAQCTLQEHINIFEAIKDRQPEQAADRMYLHIGNSINDIK